MDPQEGNFAKTEMGCFHQGVAVSGVINKSPRVAKSKKAGSTQAVYYGFDMARTLKGLLWELLFVDIGVAIPTYVRSDSCKITYQVGLLKTAPKEKLLSGLLWSNKGLKTIFG